MDILATVVDHTDSFLLLFDGRETRFDASLQDMIKKMTIIFGHNWWDYLVIGVSFWAYDQNSIEERQCYPEYPEYCKDEAWFCGEMNRQLQEKFNVKRNFTCVFTDSWSQTPGPPGFNTEDPLQQQHWATEAGKLWDITTSREDSFSFMTIDDILEENTQLKAENKLLKDIIHDNITQLTEMIDGNAQNIQNNVQNIQSNAQNIQDNADNLAIVETRVNANDGDIVQTNRRVDEHKTFIDKNTEDIAETNKAVENNHQNIAQNTNDIVTLNLDFASMNLAPIGTITAWVTKPTKDTDEDQVANLPDGWVRCSPYGCNFYFESKYDIWTGVMETQFQSIRYGLGSSLRI